MSDMNLDLLCARYGYRMANEIDKKFEKNVENHITKSLGVLQENGVYAFFLYQEKESAKELVKISTELLGEVLKSFSSIIDPLEVIRGNDKQKGLADDLDSLLLAKRLLEQSLIYARYHSKALKNGQKEREEEQKQSKPEEGTPK